MRSATSLAHFEEVYVRYGGFVAAVLLRLGVPSAVVHDAVQDVFIAAHRNWLRFDTQRAAQPWLVGIARNVAFRYRRSASRQQRKARALELTSPNSDPPLEDAAVARDFLRHFVGNLAPDLGEVFVLAELEGYTAPEIADRLGVPTPAVYQRLRRARDQLQRAVTRDAQRSRERPAVPAFAILAARVDFAAPVATALGGTWASAKGLAMIATLSFGFGGVVLATTGDRTPDPPEQVSPAGHTTSVGAAKSARATEPAVPPPAVPPPSLPLPAVPPPPEPSTPTKTSKVARATPVVRDTLAEESALLRAAHDRLAAGQATLALEKLDEHERRFPSGQLADARQRNRVRALCDLGRKTEASALAERLAAANPQDPLAARASRICSDAPRQLSASPEN